MSLGSIVFGIAGCLESPSQQESSGSTTDPSAEATSADESGEGSEAPTGEESDAGDESEETAAETDSESQACNGSDAVPSGRPLRRLTRFEYNQTVRDLLGDTTSPANALPSEDLGNGFGNDTVRQSVSSLLAEQYSTVAEEVAGRFFAAPAEVSRFAPCVSEMGESSALSAETECAREFLEALTLRAYRRPPTPEELNVLLALQQELRTTTSFSDSLAGVTEAILQSPDFLYRVEHGEDDGAGRRRPTGYEMASRLSYFLWGTMPDDDLFAAAASGELATPEGVLAHATRMLESDRARTMVRFFFDNLLPISALSSLERDAEHFPTFSASVGALLREETQTFLAHTIFEGSGSWHEVLTAPFTYVNAPLAAYYGIEGVTGETFQRVDLDTSKRLGLLTQGGVVAGTIHSNETNPVVRGSFIVQKLMCIPIPLPTGDILAEIKPPDPDSGATARERFSQHSEDPACRSCHVMMDPVGLALENFDPVGLWRDTENGVTIDARGGVPGSNSELDGPVALARAIAEAPQTHDCIVRHWTNFAFGQTSGSEDQCTLQPLQEGFVASDSNLRDLLLAMTQSPAFLYLPEESP